MAEKMDPVQLYVERIASMKVAASSKACSALSSCIEYMLVQL